MLHRCGDAAHGKGGVMFGLFAPKGKGLFFGVGTGRCGTMFLSNVLSAHPDITCLHEGMRRNGTEKGEALLNFLTLQNYATYSKPKEAGAMFAKARSTMPDVRKQQGKKLLGDIAYNYAPFVSTIGEQFPAAKIIYVYRNGIDFVRSVVTDESPDPCPVGWQEKRKQTREERYIELGRLRPLPSDLVMSQWQHMDVIAKNAWLWAETNRIIQKQLESVPTKNILRIRFEDFFANVDAGYQQIAAFLGVNPALESVQQTLHTHINERSKKTLPTWNEWSDVQRDSFTKYAGAMMEQLGYTSQNKAAAA